jgi:hypothetical protein
MLATRERVIKFPSDWNFSKPLFQTVGQSACKKFASHFTIKQINKIRGKSQ